MFGFKVDGNWIIPIVSVSCSAAAPDDSGSWARARLNSSSRSMRAMAATTLAQCVCLRAPEPPGRLKAGMPDYIIAPRERGDTRRGIPFVPGRERYPSQVVVRAHCWQRRCCFLPSLTREDRGMKHLLTGVAIAAVLA